MLVMGPQSLQLYWCQTGVSSVQLAEASCRASGTAPGLSPATAQAGIFSYVAFSTSSNFSVSDTASLPVTESQALPCSRKMSVLIIHVPLL